MTEHPTDDLGLYALGLLEPAEREAIERHLATCETCRAELRAHEATTAMLAEGAARTPPSALRDIVVARHRRGSFAALPGLAFAATLVLLVAFAGALVSLLQERAARDEYAQALSAVARGARVVPLQGTTGRGALVLPRSGAAYLVLELPAPPAGQMYEAWLIRDGQPRAMGVFPVRDGVVTLALREEVRPGDVAAVTVEAREVDRPTGQPILAGGT